MADTTDLFRSNPGRFGLCSEVWDGKRFRRATVGEIEKCCLDTCVSQASSCLNEAKTLYGPENDQGDYNKYIDATNNCARIIQACENTCALSSPSVWRGDSPIIDCIEKNGCGKYPHYNEECIKNKKNKLIRCCNKNCWPSREMSCTAHCTMKYGDFIGKSTDPLIKIYDNSKNLTADMYKNDPDNTSDNSWVYYVITLGVVVMIVAVFLFLRR